MGRLRVTTLSAVMIAATLSFAASLAFRTPCMGPPYDASGYSLNYAQNQYRLICETDVQFLWTGRGIEQDRFPYVNGWHDTSQGTPGYLYDGAMEYPVIQGMYMWLGGLPANNSTQFQIWAAITLFPVALLIAWMLESLVGRRALIWAAAPAIVFYGVFNWDLLPVAWTVAAVYSWRKGRPTLAAVFLGLGAATKMYPGFLLLPLLIERWVARDRPGAVKVAAAGGGSWLAVNLPFMLINFHGWWATYAFQSGRLSDGSTNSIWFWTWPDWPVERVDLVSMTVIAALWALALVYGWWFRTPNGEYPWIHVGAAMLFGFLAFNKVYSPQYILWALPFIVLVRFGWKWWATYFVIDAVLFVGIFRWFYAYEELPRRLAMVAGYGKTVILVTMFFAVWYRPLAFKAETAPEPSPNLDPSPAMAGGEATDLGPHNHKSTKR